MDKDVPGIGIVLMMFHLMVRVIAATAVTLLGIAGVVASPALSQQGNYAPVQGDLRVASDPETGGRVLLSGDGFAPDSPVQVKVVGNATGEVVIEEATTATASGQVEYDLVIGPNLPLGNYTVSLNGVTEDGATIVLSGAMEVEPEGSDEDVASPTTLPGEDTPERALDADSAESEGPNLWVIAPLAAIAAAVVLGGMGLVYRRSNAG